MFGISWDQISGLVQRALMFAGGFAVAKGWISEQLMVQIVGALVGVFGVLWGVKSNTQTALVGSVAAMAADPSSPVKGVVVEQNSAGRELIVAVDSAHVVPANTAAAARVAKG